MASNLTEDPKYRGEFSNIYQVHKAIPGGGKEGEYVTILGKEHYWNASADTWVISQYRDDYWNELLQSRSEEVEKIPQIAEKTNNLIKAGYLYGGVLEPLSPLPDTVLSEHNVFFLAFCAGHYNVSGLVLEEGEVAIIEHKNDGKYGITKLDLARKSVVDDLAKDLSDLDTFAKGKGLKNVLSFDGFTNTTALTGKAPSVDGIYYSTTDGRWVAKSGVQMYREWQGSDVWNQNGYPIKTKLYINKTNQSIYHFNEDGNLISGICTATDSGDNTEYADV